MARDPVYDPAQRRVCAKPAKAPGCGGVWVEPFLRRRDQRCAPCVGRRGYRRWDT
jgi:hypothetical protein